MSGAVSQRHEPRSGRAAGGLIGADLESVAWLLFAAAAAAASALILWFGRGLTFSLDELIWVASTPDLGLGDAFDPHNGHLIATTRLLYKAILETLGTDYLAFRLLTLASAVLTASLMFAYAKRRIGPLAALAPSLLILFFGAAYLHLLLGNGFTILFALACGLAALLALERDDRGGDIAACALLCLGVVTYTVALAFVVGVGVSVLLRDDRWRRIWIPAVPAILYLVWWLYAQGLERDPQGEVTIENILLLPSWAYQSLSSLLGAISGLDYRFSEASLRAGPTLAVAAVAAVAWRLIRRPVPRPLWAALAIVITLWAMGALAAGLVRLPGDSRYLFPLLIGALVFAVWAAAEVRWTRQRLIALYAIAAIAVATNGLQLSNGGEALRGGVPAILAQVGALDLAGDRADPDLDLEAAADAAGSTPSYTIPGTSEATAVEAYRGVAERYGALGYSIEELRGLGEPERALVDSILVRALELAPAPGVPGRGAACRELQPAVGGLGGIELAPGDAVSLEAGAAPAEVSLRRFAETRSVPVGTVAPGEPAELRIPADEAPDPWVLSTSAPTTVCAIE